MTRITRIGKNRVTHRMFATIRDRESRVGIAPETALLRIPGDEANIARSHNARFCRPTAFLHPDAQRR
jgi:hypothetical protein